MAFRPSSVVRTEASIAAPFLHLAESGEKILKEHSKVRKENFMTNESNFPAVFFEDFLAALRKVQDENRIHGNVEVFELRPSPDGAVHLGVSWPSIGTVPPEEAKKFAEEVARAAAAAAAFPYNGYVYTFE